MSGKNNCDDVMKYNAILLTDISDYFIPFRVHGAYYIAAHLRDHGYTVKVIDYQSWLWENHGKELVSLIESMIGPETLFIGFSSTFSRYFGEPGGSPKNIIDGLLTKEDCFFYMKELIDRVHLMHPHVKLILGGQGIQTYTFYEQFEEELDCWIRGLGEDSILTVIRNIENGIENPPIINDPASPIFDFHNQKNIFDKEDNIFQHEVLPLAISRGCRFKCKFCTFPLLGRKPSDEYIRSEESIYSELMHNYENFSTASYMLTDDTFNETTDKVERLLRVVERTGVDMNFWAYLRVELLHKFPEQIELLGQMGLKACFFGIESLYDPSAKSIGKGLGRGKILDTLQRAKDVWGVDSSLHGSFIIGLPHETRETADEWTTLLIEGETALDSIGIKALHLTPDYIIKSGHDSKVFYSEFDLNKEKYGYKETSARGTGRAPGRGWVNEHWTREEANLYAEDVFKRFKEKRPFYTDKKSVQNGMACMNLKITNPTLEWKDIHKILSSQEDIDSFDVMCEDTKQFMYDTYKENLLYGEDH